MGTPIILSQATQYNKTHCFEAVNICHPMTALLPWALRGKKKIAPILLLEKLKKTKITNFCVYQLLSDYSQTDSIFLFLYASSRNALI